MRMPYLISQVVSVVIRKFFLFLRHGLPERLQRGEEVHVIAFLVLNKKVVLYLKITGFSHVEME